MDIFKPSSQSYINSGINAEQNAFNQSAQFEQPYTQNAGTDFNSMRNFLYKSLQSRPNYNDQFDKALSITPEALLQHAMAGYNQNPFEQNKTQDEIAAAENQSSASLSAQGLSGSPNAQILNSGIAAGITGESEQNGMTRYLNELLKTAGFQQGILSNYNKQTQGLEKGFQSLVGQEEHSSDLMAGNAMKLGENEGMLDRSGADINRNNSPIEQIASLGSALAGLLLPTNVLGRRKF